MAHPRLRHVDDCKPCLADAQAPLQVLGIEEKVLVEHAGRVDRRARDRHRRAGGTRRVPELTRRIRLAEALVPAAPKDGVEAGAGVPEPVGVGEEHLAAEDAGVRPCRRGARQCVDEPRFHERWEGRAFAASMTMGAAGLWNIDVGRYGIERLAPALAAAYA